ncbi:exported hypothetical protein [Desulfosarcina cetonica]|uniref:hypothetical protein n=1 Tax=Desulfosarcina cetonica TaxID=90730 RepID=UPI0006D24411|nr:hypothetical protein [Desulfosarcina cetonica]VTR68065.1 exported hypothetical protein [Desulfosarcina cetonica]
MKKSYTLCFLATLLLLVGACAKKHQPVQIKIPRNAAKMEVTFSWDGIPACAHESPEIKVAGIPDGAVELQVRLKDINLPVWNQGGGKVAVDGSGVIPAGALNMGYNGPCPPAGQRHKYEFSVMAVDDQGTIIGYGASRQVFPPKK